MMNVFPPIDGSTAGPLAVTRLGAARGDSHTSLLWTSI